MFTSHVFVLLCIGLSRSFYHFRCWLSFWWRLLYGWWPLRSHGLWHQFREVCRLVLRLVARRLSILSYMFWEMWELFLCIIFLGIRYILLYCFDKTLLRSLGAYVRTIIHFNEIYVTDIYVNELSACWNSILKMVLNIFIIRCD